jgi:hypothetical protein
MVPPDVLGVTGTAGTTPALEQLQAEIKATHRVVYGSVAEKP